MSPVYVPAPPRRLPPLSDVLAFAGTVFLMVVIVFGTVAIGGAP